MKLNLLFFIFFINNIVSGQVVQNSSNLPTLNYKGVWILHDIEQKLGCSKKIELTSDPSLNDIQTNMIIVKMASCDSNLVTTEKLRSYFHLLFWHGIENHENFDGVSIPSYHLLWNKNDDNFSYQRPDSITVFGRTFIQTSDSTYNVYRNDRLIVEHFKTSYFDNCIYKTDTVNVISMKQQWKNRWQIPAPCEPFHLMKSDKNIWGSSNDWTFYSLPCERNGKLKLRTIALSKDSLFQWNWGLGGAELLSAGTYSIYNDTLLVLQSDFDIMDSFIEEYKLLHPDQNVASKYLIQRQYLIREDKIYFVNEYR